MWGCCLFSEENARNPGQSENGSPGRSGHALSLSTDPFPALSTRSPGPLWLPQWTSSGRPLWRDPSGLHSRAQYHTPSPTKMVGGQQWSPVFVTCPLKRMEKMMEEAAVATEQGQSSEATVLLRRLKVYTFSVRVPPPPEQLPMCAHCFADFVLIGESAWCRRQQ